MKDARIDNPMTMDGWEADRADDRDDSHCEDDEDDRKPETRTFGGLTMADDKEMTCATPGPPIDIKAMLADTEILFAAMKESDTTLRNLLVAAQTALANRVRENCAKEVCPECNEENNIPQKDIDGYFHIYLVKGFDCDSSPCLASAIHSATVEYLMRELPNGLSN